VKIHAQVATSYEHTAPIKTVFSNTFLQVIKRGVATRMKKKQKTGRPRCFRNALPCDWGVCETKPWYILLSQEYPWRNWNIKVYIRRIFKTCDMPLLGSRSQKDLKIWSCSMAAWELESESLLEYASWRSDLSPAGKMLTEDPGTLPLKWDSRSVHNDVSIFHLSPSSPCRLLYPSLSCTSLFVYESWPRYPDLSLVYCLLHFFLNPYEFNWSLKRSDTIKPLSSPMSHVPCPMPPNRSAVRNR